MALDVDSILAAIAPGFSYSPYATTFKELAISETSESYFGDFYNKAVALRAAHEWTLSTLSGNESGSISSKRMGPVSVSYQGTSGTSSLTMTRFGRELMSLIQRRGVGAAVTGCSMLE